MSPAQSTGHTQGAGAHDGDAHDRGAPGPVERAPSPSNTLAYIPSLDGVRAVAVLGVMAFHGGIPFVTGGFLGVDAFFVLSGFLITTLLVEEWRNDGTVRLRAFWARRARRLFPALLLVVVFVVCYAAFVAPAGTYPDLRSDALASLFYVANWHFIAAGTNYFAQTGPVSPLTHTWSLAVEEQFYLAWPLVVAGVLWLGRGLRPLLVLAVAGVGASAIEMAALYRGGDGLTRLYYGTDTHAQSLLVGVVLALALAMAPRRAGAGRWVPVSRTAGAAVAAAGTAGLAVDAVLWWRASYDGSFLWQGGFLLADVATAAVLLSAVCVPEGALSKVLSLSPLRFAGRISYGVYLWHFPLFIWLDAARTGVSGYGLFGLRVAVTVAVATVSYYALEQPIRRGTVLRRWRARLGTPVAFAAVAAFAVATTSGASIAAPAAPAGGAEGSGARTILVVGDSTAFTLGVGLTFTARAHHTRVVDEGILGCGVAEAGAFATAGRVLRSASACNPSTPRAERWPALWKTWTGTYHPSVVVVLAGRWEVSDVRWHGRWTSIGTHAFAAYVRRQLARAVRIASSSGAHVDLLTAPCYADPGQAAGTAPPPGDTAHRLAVYNGIVRAVAASDARTASLVDFGAMVCPGGHYRQTIGHVTVRAPDGVHFPFFSLTHPGTADPDTVAQVRAFGAWLGRTLWPELAPPAP